MQIGADCVIMENAVLRGTARHPLLTGDRVLAGPHAQLTGCTVTDEVFIAAGAMVCNGAHLGRAVSVGPGQLSTWVPSWAPTAQVPVGWVAAGDPARIYPTGEAEAIQAAQAEARWSFLPLIFGIDDAGGRREQLGAALARYTAAMIRHHCQDELIPVSEDARAASVADT